MRSCEGTAPGQLSRALRVLLQEVSLDPLVGQDYPYLHVVLLTSVLCARGKEQVQLLQ